MPLFIEPISPHQWALATMLMECGGEPYEGKVAVAHVLLNRAKGGKTLTEVCLAPWQFSSWGTDSVTKRLLYKPDYRVWEECRRAFEAAYFNDAPDPTKGATHYLNKEVLEKAGKLPKWFDPAKVTAVIGHHTFLKGV